MNIVYIGWGLPPEMPSIPEAILPRFLAKQGHQVTVHVIGPGPELAGVTVRRYKERGPDLAEADVVIVNHRENPLSLPALRWAEENHVPSIYMAHDPFFHPLGEHGRRTDWLVVFSNVERRLRINEFNPGRIEVIPNGLDFDLYELKEIPQRDGDLLYVGQCVEWKGVLDLVEAMNQLPRHHLTMLCHIDGVSDLVRERSQAGNIDLEILPIGKRRFRDLVTAFYRHRTLVCPSHTDCFPTVVLEAIHCGCKVIATRIGGIPEQVRSAGILVGPKNVKDLVAAIAVGELEAAAIEGGLGYEWSAQRQANQFVRLLERAGG